MRNPQILSSEQTCFGCPEEHEGRLTDGRWFYFRYRSGWASLAVRDNYEDVAGQQDVGMEVGDGLQGIFDNSEQRDEVFAELLARASRPQASLPRPSELRDGPVGNNPHAAGPATDLDPWCAKPPAGPFPIVEVDPAEIAEGIEALARHSARLRESEERDGGRQIRERIPGGDS